MAWHTAGTQKILIVVNGWIKPAAEAPHTTSVTGFLVFGRQAHLLRWQLRCHQPLPGGKHNLGWLTKPSVAISTAFDHKNFSGLLK